MGHFTEPDFDGLKYSNSDQDLAKFVKTLLVFVKKSQDINSASSASRELESFIGNRAGLLTPTFRLIFEKIQIAISNPVAAAVSDLLDVCLEHFIERRGNIDDDLDGVDGMVEVLVSCILRSILNQLMPGSHKEVGDPYPLHNGLARKRVTAEIYRRTLPQFCRYMNMIPHKCDPPAKICICMQLRPLDLWIELIVLHEIPAISPEIFAPFIRKLHDNIFKKVWSRGWFVCLHTIYPDYGQKDIEDWFREIFLRLRELFDTKQAVQKNMMNVEDLSDSQPVDISLAASDDSVPVLSLLNKMALTSPTLYNSNAVDNLEWMVFNPQQPCLHVLIVLCSISSVHQHLLMGRGNRWYPALDKLKMSENLRHSAALKLGEIFVNLLINATTHLHDAEERKRVLGLMANALTKSPYKSVKRSVLEVWLLMSKIPLVASQLKSRIKDVDTLVQDKQLGALSRILSKKLQSSPDHVDYASKGSALNDTTKSIPSHTPNQLDSAACVIM